MPPFARNDSVRHYIAIGFSLLIILMVVLSITALSQLRTVNQDLHKVVSDTNTKIASAYSMRDAIRQRALSLRNARLTDDPFLRDSHAMDFINHARQYREAREQLLELDMDSKEKEIHTQLFLLTKSAQPYNDRAMEYILDEAGKQAIDTKFVLAEQMQNRLLSLLDELIHLEEQYAELSRTKSQQNYIKTQYVMAGLILLIISLGITIAIYILRLTDKSTEHIKYQATHDSLTGLINRREFETRLEMATHTAKTENLSHALLYIDLDEFKIINDSGGHIAGDTLLRSLPDVLHSTLRKSDTVARLGGDEFGILLHDCNMEKAKEIATDVKDSIASFIFTWENKQYSIGSSIGVVTIDENSGDTPSILKHADMACYAAKEKGKNYVYMFRLEDINMLRRHGEIKWAGVLKDALANNSLNIYLQPIESSGTQETDQDCQRYEVLIRLNDEDGEIIEPRKFIPAAERYRMMPEVDQWVIDQIFKLCPENNYHGKTEPLLCVNLSSDSLHNEKFLNNLFHKLSNNPVLSSHICFEIKEDAIISKLQYMDTVITRLKSYGCRISIDNFGAGITSLYYLKNLDVDYVKIEGSFVRNILSDRVSHDLILAATHFCHTLGIGTIAESVESDETRTAVHKLGIDYAQGYAIGHPLPCNRYLSSIPDASDNVFEHKK